MQPQDHVPEALWKALIIVTAEAVWNSGRWLVNLVPRFCRWLPDQLEWLRYKPLISFPMRPDVIYEVDREKGTLNNCQVLIPLQIKPLFPYGKTVLVSKEAKLVVRVHRSGRERRYEQPCFTTAEHAFGAGSAQGLTYDFQWSVTTEPNPAKAPRLDRSFNWEIVGMKCRLDGPEPITRTLKGLKGRVIGNDD
jgi:hypothetical protein